MKMLAAIVLSAVVAAPAFAQQTVPAQEYSGPPRVRAAATTDQIIVKWRSKSSSTMAAPQRAGKLSAAGGVGMQHKRRSAAGSEVFKLERRMNAAELQVVLDRLNADPAVEYAVADRRRQAQRVPNDPFVADQWYLLSVEASATRGDKAWDTTIGSNTTVVAVLDTGVRPEHPDLAGKLLPGYDFIDEIPIANDGDGPDADASDPGDWIDNTDVAQAIFDDCERGASSWHGTRVSSLIGATTDEGAGMAGAAWDARILPVRVLGKCGGFDSDIIDGMRWAAGLPVEGAPLNPTPAKIINLSLGSDGACTVNYQNAIDEVTAQGSLVIASVGNDGIPVGAPANCSNVLGVSGIRHAGTKVGYSNLGAGADIAAPAGNCVNTTIRPPSPPEDPDGSPCVYSLLVARDSGTTVPMSPTYSDRFSSANFGTSFSSPLVAGAAALVTNVNPKLAPAQIATVLQESASPFPTTSSTTNNICRVPTNFVQGEECICTTATCGSGMLDTGAAITAALKPFGIVQSPASIDPNVSVNISGATSFGAPGRDVTTYQWSILNVTGGTPTIADTGAATTTLQVPANSRFTLRLRVTDDAGTTDDTDFAMVTTTPPDVTTTPIGSGGGGGSFDWWLLVLGLLPLALPGPRRRKAARVRGRSTPRSQLLRDMQEVDGSTSRSHRRRRRQHFPQ